MHSTAAPIAGADLFCGAGGTSTGLMMAARELGIDVELLAVNHWQVAIATHSVNHPQVRHLWADIEAVSPREVVPSGRLRFLAASPECIYFSRARGGKPIDDQKRASANYVLRWLEDLDVEDVLLENVREFSDWGPLYPDDYPVEKLRGKPIPERKGECFREFIAKLEAMGYTVEWRILCAADYGDATSRERFFLRARRGGGAITWPEPTHPRASWRPAREIIDWRQPGRSIYGRQKPLVPATMHRIYAGIRKFSGLAPFIVEYHGNHPGTNSGARRHRRVDEPLATQDTSNRFGLALPYLTKLYGGADACSLDETLPTITAQYEHYGLTQPYLVTLRNHADGAPVHGPLPTVCAGGQHHGIAQPYLIPHFGERDGQTPRAHSVDAPAPTVTSHGAGALCQPYLVNMKGRSTAADVGAPMPTQTAHAQHIGVAQPFLTKYYGTGVPADVNAPLDTATTVDRFGVGLPLLCGASNEHHAHLLEACAHPDPLYRPLVALIDGTRYLVDILYRMLMPRELAAAMSFPDTYVLTGSQADQVKQVGNAVPCLTAKALFLAMLQEASQ